MNQERIVVDSYAESIHLMLIRSAIGCVEKLPNIFSTSERLLPLRTRL
jgi:hypothetical protein